MEWGFQRMDSVEELYQEYGIQVPEINEQLIKQYQAFYPCCEINSKFGIIKFMATHESVIWRIKNLFFLEPETITWIKSFDEGKRFYDIGANMGVYSIWSAISKNVKVYAFEPEVENFRLLHLNVLINQLVDKINYWPIALSDKTEISKLYLSCIQPGVSGHSFGQNLDSELAKREGVSHTQGAVSFSLDDLVYQQNLPFPNYMKVDVDGFEHKIISGGSAVLQDLRLKSVLIEINTALKEHMNIVKIMKSYGFHVDLDQVNKSKEHISNHFKGFENYANYIFYR